MLEFLGIGCKDPLATIVVRLDQMYLKRYPTRTGKVSDPYGTQVMQTIVRLYADGQKCYSDRDPNAAAKVTLAEFGLSLGVSFCHC